MKRSKFDIHYEKNIHQVKSESQSEEFSKPCLSLTISRLSRASLAAR